MTFVNQGSHAMDDESTDRFGEDGIESIKGHEVMESLGVVNETSPDYVENDDVANSIAEGDF